MAAKVSALTGSLTLTVNQWTAGFKQAERDKNAFQKSLRPLNDVVGSLGKTFVAVGAVVGGSLLALSKKAADFGDNLLDASKKTGISTQQLSAYKLMADQSGTSFEALSKGVGLLSKNIVAAAAGSKEQAKLFQAMGIAVKDAGGNLRNASDIMPEIADRLSKIEDGSLKTALAQKLFGKSGADLIPLLNEGSEGMRKAQEQTVKYGIALDKAEAILGDKFNDSLAESKAAMQGFANAVGVALLPKLTELVNKGNDWIATASKWVKAHPDLTVAIGKTSAVLVGAGGLLVGLAGVATIAPRVVQGLVLMTNAYKSLGVTMQAISLLQGVRTFQDFSAGITLIGQSSVFAKAGLIGLAAAAGYAVGQLANYLIELSGYQQQADKVISTLGKIATGDFSFVYGGGAAAPGDAKSAAMATKGLEAEAKRRGVTVQELQRQSVAAWEAQKKLNAARKPAAVVDPAADLAKLMGAFEKTNNATKDAAEEIDRWDDSLRRGFDDAVKLTNSLGVMEAHQVSASVVTGKFGDEIKQAVNEFKLWGLEVPPLLSKYNDLVGAQERLAKITEETTDKFEKEREALREITEVPIVNGGMTPALEAMKAQGAFGLRVKEATDNLTRQRDEVADLSKQILAMNRAGISARDIELALGRSIESVVIEAKELGQAIDPLTKKLGQQASAAENLRRVWGDTFASLSDQVVDMIVDFDFSFKKLKDIGLDTAKSLARSFLDGFFRPFKDGLSNLGEDLAGKLSSILFGGSGGGGSQQKAGGGGFDGIVGGAVGAALSKIFGGGGGPSAGDYARIPIPGMEGMHAANGIGGQLSGLASKLNPIGLGVGIANTAFDLGKKITGAIGSGRDSANEIVKSQEAFGRILAGILADSELSATNKLKLVSNQFEIFDRQRMAFGATGGENAVTANQSFATIAPLVEHIRRDLIKAGASDGSEGSSGNMPAFAPVFNLTFDVTLDGEMSDLEVRDELMPKITSVLESGLRGYREKWSQLLTGYEGTTPAGVGI